MKFIFTFTFTRPVRRSSCFIKFIRTNIQRYLETWKILLWTEMRQDEAASFQIPSTMLLKIAAVPGCDAVILRACFPTFRRNVTLYSSGRWVPVEWKQKPPRSYVTRRTTLPLTRLSYFTRILYTLIRIRGHTKLNTSVYNKKASHQFARYIRLSAEWKK